MAGITLSGWPSGATVSAYTAPTIPSRTPDTDALGTAVTSGVASSAGTVALSGLLQGTRYIASDGTTRRRFMVTVNASRDESWPGIYGPTSPGWAAATFTPVANTAYCYRIKANRDYAVKSAWIPVATGAAGDWEAAVYDSTGQSKLATTGAVVGGATNAGDSTAPLVISLVSSGEYLVAFACTSAPTIGSAGWNSFRSVGAYGATLSTWFASSKATSYPLPAALSGFGAVGTVALVALREI